MTIVVMIENQEFVIEQTSKGAQYIECKKGHFFKKGISYLTNRIKLPKHSLFVTGLGQLFSRGDIDNMQDYQRIYVEWK